MRILYGVNGEGMGHATRSRVVIDSLLERHDVRVVSSGNAYGFLSETLPHVDEIFGPKFAMEEGQIRRWATVVENLRSLGHELPKTVREWVARTKEWRPEVVITDFEPLSAAYSRYSRTPLVAVDNINMLDRCHHDEEIVGGEREDFLIAKAVTHSMVPGAVEYVVTTFFEPPIARACTTLVPPIVRPEIEAATSEHGDHLVVYSGGDPALTDALRASGVPCRVYGMRGGPEADEVDGNLEYRPRSQRRVRGGSADLEGRRHRGRLLAAQRGGLPGQADARDPAPRAVRADDERALSGARWIRPVRRGGNRRSGEEIPRRARRVRAGTVGLRAGRQRGLPRDGRAAGHRRGGGRPQDGPPRHAARRGGGREPRRRWASERSPPAAPASRSGAASTRPRRSSARRSAAAQRIASGSRSPTTTARTPSTRRG